MKQKELLINLGKRIRQLREQQGITQEEISERIGFHRTYIGMVERGERNISLKNIGVFAAYFQMELKELMDF
ncbi:MAG TPA: helix-turn-helix transcriptional regulator [Flavobacteriaceae bacterium]|nr:helix-turn-helix transcriptional regulator [Flavobacteriaceae bacterium]